MMPFEIHTDETIPEVKVVHRKEFADERGWFAEIFRLSDFEKMGIISEIDQINHSFSKKRGTLRGLHFQESPHEQGKMVYCMRGSIWDVAVDIRRESETFGMWVGYELTDRNQKSLWVPPGFAHGFQATSDDAEVLYLTTGEYSAQHDRSLFWNDSDIRVKWPIEDVILSDKDSSAPSLRELRG